MALRDRTIAYYCGGKSVVSLGNTANNAALFYFFELYFSVSQTRREFKGLLREWAALIGASFSECAVRTMRV